MYNRDLVTILCLHLRKHHLHHLRQLSPSNMTFKSRIQQQEKHHQVWSNTKQKTKKKNEYTNVVSFHVTYTNVLFFLFCEDQENLWITRCNCCNNVDKLHPWLMRGVQTQTINLTKLNRMQKDQYRMPMM